MIQIRTSPRLIAVWLVLSVLAAVIGLMEYSDWKQSQANRGAPSLSDQRSLLPVPVDQLTIVEVGHAGALHRFERDAAGTWFYHAHGVNTGVQAPHGHVADAAQGKLIAHAFAALGRARIERRLESDNKEEYGVTRPETLLLVYGANGIKPLAQYAIGDVAPDTFSRYVLMVDTSQMVTIANYQIENLLNLIQAVGSQPGMPPAGNDKKAGGT